MVPHDPIHEQLQKLAGIEQALSQRLGHRIQGLAISLEPCGLVLSGRCHSYYDKQMAKHFAIEMTAATTIDNRIQVHSEKQDRIHEFERDRSKVTPFFDVVKKLRSPGVRHRHGHGKDN